MGIAERSPKNPLAVPGNLLPAYINFCLTQAKSHARNGDPETATAYQTAAKRYQKSYKSYCKLAVNQG